MNTTFNLQHFWQQGDAFAHFVAIVLLVMSILSWGVIALRTLMIMRMRKLSHAIEAFWNNIRAESATRLAAVKQLDHENLVTPLAQAMDSANSRSALERKLSAAVRQSEQTLDQGLTLLATVASSAPFVGPVGEALIMTAFGLAVALPALFAYNFFSRKNQVQSAEIDAFAHDLVAEFSDNDARA